MKKKFITFMLLMSFTGLTISVSATVRVCSELIRIERTEEATAFTVSPDKRVAVIGTQSGKVFVKNLGSSDAIVELDSFKNSVRNISFSRDGSLLMVQTPKIRDLFGIYGDDSAERDYAITIWRRNPDDSFSVVMRINHPEETVVSEWMEKVRDDKEIRDDSDDSSEENCDDICIVRDRNCYKRRKVDGFDCSRTSHLEGPPPIRRKTQIRRRFSINCSSRFFNLKVIDAKISYDNRYVLITLSNGCCVLLRIIERDSVAIDSSCQIVPMYSCWSSASWIDVEGNDFVTCGSGGIAIWSLNEGGLFQRIHYPSSNIRRFVIDGSGNRVWRVITPEECHIATDDSIIIKYGRNCGKFIIKLIDGEQFLVQSQNLKKSGMISFGVNSLNSLGAIVTGYSGIGSLMDHTQQSSILVKDILSGKSKVKISLDERISFADSLGVEIIPGRKGLFTIYAIVNVRSVDSYPRLVAIDVDQTHIVRYLMERRLVGSSRGLRRAESLKRCTSGLKRHISSSGRTQAGKTHKSSSPKSDSKVRWFKLVFDDDGRFSIEKVISDSRIDGGSDEYAAGGGAGGSNS